MTTLRNKLAYFWALSLLVIALVGGSSLTHKASAQPGMQISFQTFYDELSPYGQWFNDPEYGYVWAPNVGNDFRPYYSNGYWQMTEYGNMWMSNYAWGWAPFHYGRWMLSNYGGWVWIPGNEWGPAWVTWRQGGGYYGWAPMGPGISINISFGNSYMAPNPWWTFIPYRNIYNRNFHRYYAPRQTVNIINNTTIINNTYVDNRSRNTYITGPRRADVERTTGRRVNVYNVNSSTKAGAPRVNGRNVEIYRPEVGNNSNVRNAAPREVKTVNRSTNSNTNGTGRINDRNTANERVPNNAVRPSNVNNRVINDNSNNSRSRVTEQATPANREPVRSNPNISPRNTPVQQAPQERRTEVQPRSNTPAPRTQAPQPSTRTERSSTPRVERSTPKQSVERSAPQRVERSSRSATERNAAPQRNTHQRGR
jgi:hypothetical protein